MSASPGEFDLIAKIRQTVMTDPRVPLGIGDDAALLFGSHDEAWLVAADMLLEGRHFEISSASPRLIGRKALAVNLSDIAAMAGRPVAAFVTVAHRREYGVAFAEELHAGIVDLAKEFDLVIAGGDTNVWDGPVVVSVTVLGQTVQGKAITRSGAKVGDRVFVTGSLGGSLTSGRHLTFAPRVKEALALHAAVDLHAMIDISDGLLADLGHVCDESGVGMMLLADLIPINDSVRRDSDDLSPLERALTDGEDFEIAFCVSKADAARLRTSSSPKVYEIGEATAEPGLTVVGAGGRTLDFSRHGWEHRW